MFIFIKYIFNFYFLIVSVKKFLIFPIKKSIRKKYFKVYSEIVTNGSVTPFYALKKAVLQSEYSKCLRDNLSKFLF